jgi:hypothetical protein
MISRYIVPVRLTGQQICRPIYASWDNTVARAANGCAVNGIAIESRWKYAKGASSPSVQLNKVTGITLSLHDRAV